MTPTPERFRPLARSSPYRWDALAFDVAWPDRAVRLLVRRPDLHRVEDGRGGLLQAGRQGVGPLVAPLTSDGSGVPHVPSRPPAVLDEDGLHTVPRVPARRAGARPADHRGRRGVRPGPVPLTVRPGVRWARLCR